jgi:peroxiredoxin Q/BCP
MARTLMGLFIFGSLWGCGGSKRSDSGTGLLAAGSSAPDVSGVDQNGQPHRLSETLGKWVVVYFYPKDQTPGCTKEACAFRDVWDRYQAAGVALFGVSKGTEDSHKKFAAKHSLPFPLIADTDQAWGAAFGVPSMMGMYRRVSFLISDGGKIAKVYDDVDPGVHATQILEDVKALRH